MQDDMCTQTETTKPLVVKRKSFLAVKNTANVQCHRRRLSSIFGSQELFNEAIVNCEFNAACEDVEKEIHCEKCADEKGFQVFLCNLDGTVIISGVKEYIDDYTSISNMTSYVNALNNDSFNTSSTLSLYREAAEHSTLMSETAQWLTSFMPIHSGKNFMQGVLQNVKLMEIASAVLVTAYLINQNPAIWLKTLSQNLLLFQEEKHVDSLTEREFYVINNTLTQNDLSSLEDRNWLNDQVIHAYLGILASEYPDVLFLPNLLGVKWSVGEHFEMLYPKVNFGKYRAVLLPLKVPPDVQWILLSAHKNETTILDSRNGYQDMKKSIFLNWKKYLRSRAKILKCKYKDDVLLEKLVLEKGDRASCGLFVLMYAEAICKGIEPYLLRRCHMENARVYVRSRLLAHAKPVDGTVCAMPFCRVPQGKHNSTVDCYACLRVFHCACICLSDTSSTFICISCETPNGGTADTCSEEKWPTISQS